MHFHVTHEKLFSKYVYVNAESNSLTGPIPTELGNLEALSTLLLGKDF